MENIVIAAIVAITTLVTSLIAPIGVGFFTYRIQRADRREDWARQDMVAQRARDVAEAARLAALDVSEKLDMVHALVNSQLTAALQAEHDALLGQLSPETPTTKAAEIIRGRIAELAFILEKRAIS